MAQSRYLLIGNPVAHSLSPAMHRQAFRALGISATYDARSVQDHEIMGIMDLLRGGELAGINVTLPYKTRMLDLVDVLSAEAKASGAINTIVRAPGGELVGHNTDALALKQRIESRLLQASSRPASQALANKLSQPVRHPRTIRRAAVLGTGGAARASLFVFGAMGVREVCIVGRDLRKALALAHAFSVQFAETRFSAQTFDTPSAMDNVCVFAQATSAPMAGHHEAQTSAESRSLGDNANAIERFISATRLRSDAIVVEWVYGVDTPTVRMARALCATLIDGLELLREQGRRALELWTGTSIAPEAYLYHDAPPVIDTQVKMAHKATIQS